MSTNRHFSDSAAPRAAAIIDDLLSLELANYKGMPIVIRDGEEGRSTEVALTELLRLDLVSRQERPDGSVHFTLNRRLATIVRDDVATARRALRTVADGSEASQAVSLLRSLLESFDSHTAFDAAPYLSNHNSGEE